MKKVNYLKNIWKILDKFYKRCYNIRRKRGRK